MPRLTDEDYLSNYDRLRWTWNQHRQVYSYLSPTEQWRLHAYYRPSKDLTDTQLISHRRKVTRDTPALPHQAGKIIAKLDALATASRNQSSTSGPLRSDQRVFVRRVVVQPELDLKKLARVIIADAERKQRSEQEAA